MINACKISEGVEYIFRRLALGLPKHALAEFVQQASCCSVSEARTRHTVLITVLHHQPTQMHTEA